MVARLPLVESSGNTVELPSGDTIAIPDENVTNGMLRHSAALSVIGRASNSTGDPADISFGTDGGVLRRSGTSLVTTKLPVGDLDYAGLSSGYHPYYNGTSLVDGVITTDGVDVDIAGRLSFDGDSNTDIYRVAANNVRVAHTLSVGTQTLSSIIKKIDGTAFVFTGSSGNLIIGGNGSGSGQYTDVRFDNSGDVELIGGGDLILETGSTLRINDLTDGYYPYHSSDAAGLVDGPLSTDGTDLFMTDSLYHTGDTDTGIEFTDNRIEMKAGGNDNQFLVLNDGGIRFSDGNLIWNAVTNSITVAQVGTSNTNYVIGASGSPSYGVIELYDTSNNKAFRAEGTTPSWYLNNQTNQWFCRASGVDLQIEPSTVEGDFVIRDLGDSEIFTIATASGDVDITTGDLTVSAGKTEITSGGLGIGTSPDNSPSIRLGERSAPGAIASTNIFWRDSSNNHLNLIGGTNNGQGFRLTFTDDGYLGIGVVPTAAIDTAASTTSRASTRTRAGTAPTSPNAGDGWNDDTQKCFVDYPDGIKIHRGGTLFTGTADKTVENTTSETTMIPTGVGTVSLPADFFVAGKTIRVRMKGTYKRFVSAKQLTIKFKLGSTVIESITSMFPTLTTTGRWLLEYEVTCRTTGASGTFSQAGFLMAWTTVNADLDDTTYIGDTITTADTTAALAFDITGTWDQADTNLSITTEQCVVEVLN